MSVQLFHRITLASNNAFENGRADKQLALGKSPWRRAAQRGR